VKCLTNFTTNKIVGCSILRYRVIIQIRGDQPAAVQPHAAFDNIYATVDILQAVAAMH